MATNQSDPVARIYAVALYETARDKGIVGDVQKGLEVLMGVWDDKSFRDFFTSPRIPRPVKIKGMDEALKGRVIPEVLNFVKVLIAKGRENRVHAWVEAGSPFGDGELAAVKAALSAASSGKDVVLHYQHKPELMGGARIRLGDRMIDNSLQTRLAHLALSMK